MIAVWGVADDRLWTLYSGYHQEEKVMPGVTHVTRFVDRVSENIETVIVGKRHTSC